MLAWPVVLCVSAAVQLLTPSGVLPGGGGPSYRMLPRAWMRVVVKLRPVVNDAPDRATTIELSSGPESRERVIASTAFQSAADVRALLSDGALTFHDIPTEQPIHLRITIRSHDGTPLRTYAESYVLHFPDKARVDSRGARAVEESGYLGDFVIDHVNAGVTRIWRDQ